jgi:hypothetical protein
MTHHPQQDELLRIWPKRPNRKVRMVWINTHDPPPPLPDGWGWHEEHRCSAEALWEEVAALQRPDAGAAVGVFERWKGQPLFVIMGAGTSVQVSCVYVCRVYIGARGSSPRGGRGRSLSAPKLTGVGSIHYTTLYTHRTSRS